MSDGITFEAKMGHGSKASEGVLGKLMNVGKRAPAGESIFKAHSSNIPAFHHSNWGEAPNF